MTARPTPQCCLCAHWVSPLDRNDWTGTVQTCVAYPGGIPDPVWWNRADHRQPFPDDQGLQWTAMPGRKFPAHALARRGGGAKS